MPQADRIRAYRPTALDRTLAPARTVAVVGPVANLDVDRVRANLKAAQIGSAASRIALEPRGDQREWQYRSVTQQSVVERSDLATADLGGLVTRIQNRPGPRNALDVFVCGDYLVVDYSHGMGDGQLGLTMLAALSGEVDPERTAMLTAELPSRAVWNGLLRHYRSRPAAVRDFLRLRRLNKRPGPDQPADRRTIAESDLGKLSLAAYMKPEQVTALRTWAKTNAVDASTAAVTVALWLAALRASGVTVDERVMILLNCRRYLDPKYIGAQGNFAVGIPVRLPAPGSPEAIGEVIRDVIESGWPIAVLGMADVKATLRAVLERGEPLAPSGPVEVPNRLRIAVSDLGRPAMFEHTSWVPGRPPQVAAYLEPDGPDAATLLVSELAGVRTFTATFCGGMVDPAVIARALTRMCDDPVGTLRSALR